jgi:hypothetical protein
VASKLIHCLGIVFGGVYNTREVQATLGNVYSEYVISSTRDSRGRLASLFCGSNLPENLHIFDNLGQYAPARFLLESHPDGRSQKGGRLTIGCCYSPRGLRSCCMIGVRGPEKFAKLSPHCVFLSVPHGTDRSLIDKYIHAKEDTQGILVGVEMEERRNGQHDLRKVRHNERLCTLTFAFPGPTIVPSETRTYLIVELDGSEETCAANVGKRLDLHDTSNPGIAQNGIRIQQQRNCYSVLVLECHTDLRLDHSCRRSPVFASGLHLHDSSKSAGSTDI